MNKHILVIPIAHYVTPTYPFAGIFEKHQIEAMAKVGNKIGVISVGAIPFRFECIFYPYQNFEKDNNLTIYRNYKRSLIPPRFMSFKMMYKFLLNLFFIEFDKYINKNGLPEIIHAHNFLYSGLIAKDIYDKYNIPYIITEHSSFLALNPVFPDCELLIKKAAKDAYTVTAVSSHFKSILNKKFGFKCRLLPNLIDESFVVQENTTYRNKEIFNFLSVGNLIELKNHELLLRAFAKNFRGKKCNLKIGGIGHLKNRLINLSKSLLISDQVEFLGFLNRSEVRNHMTDSSCFVLTSNFETFGVVLIESLSCGTPVISTRCGGPIDIVDETNGILVPINDVDELSNAMLRVFYGDVKFDSEMLKENVILKFGRMAFLERVSEYYNLKIV
jgi:glycosyltransferase involved in cell wall biosynthesis